MKKIIFIFSLIFICGNIFATNKPEIPKTGKSNQVTAYFTNYKYTPGSHYKYTADIVCSEAATVSILYTIEGTHDDFDMYFWVGDTDCYMMGSFSYKDTVYLPKGKTSVKLQVGNTYNARIYMTILKEGNVIPIDPMIFGIY